MNSRRNDHCSVIKMKKLHYFKISHEKSKIGDRQCTKKQIITTDILNGGIGGRWANGPKSIFAKICRFRFGLLLLANLGGVFPLDSKILGGSFGFGEHPLQISS